MNRGRSTEERDARLLLDSDLRFGFIRMVARNPGRGLATSSLPVMHTQLLNIFRSHGNESTKWIDRPEGVDSGSRIHHVGLLAGQLPDACQRELLVQHFLAVHDEPAVTVVLWHSFAFSWKFGRLLPPLFAIFICLFLVLLLYKSIHQYTPLRLASAS